MSFIISLDVYSYFLQVLAEKCGAGYSGVCSRFLTDSNTSDRLMFYMDQRNFTDVAGLFFRFLEREVDRGFEIMKYESFLSSAPYANRVSNCWIFFFNCIFVFLFLFVSFFLFFVFHTFSFHTNIKKTTFY